MYENGSNRTIIALFQHERTNVYSICYFGSLIRFPHFIIMVGEPPSLPPLTARRWFFVIQNFEQLALALKNRVCSELFHCVEIFLIFQDFWATLYFSKKTVFPWIFHCIEIFVIFQDFWATCACPENRVCPETFHCIEYIFIIHRIFEQLCAWPEKQNVPWNFSLCWIYFSSFRIFEQLVLAVDFVSAPQRGTSCDSAVRFTTSRTKLDDGND